MVREDMIPWLYGLRHLGIKLGLDNIRGLLGELEHPERAFRSVHVAGTNGKGSVAAMIDALLAAAGVASGMFTSPHLVRPHERIRLAGRDIADDELQRRLSEMRRTIETGLAESRLEVHPSFFEVMTATALQAFKDHGLEAAALEVGLGGRLDATNAVPADVAVVVSIALDHMKTLGGTLEKIAFEKAGIIKRGQPVVSGVAQQRAIDVLRTVCLERGARWIDARLAARLVSEDHGSFTLESDHARYPDLRLPLAGRHQIDNARIALTAFELLMERLGRRPEPGAVQAGFASVRWPGRVQWVEPEEGGPRLLLDAAYIPAGLQTLTSYLREQGLTSLVMLFSATTGKPLSLLLGALAEFVDSAVVTSTPVERSVDAEEIAQLARPLFPRVDVRPDVAAGLERARDLAGADGVVLVTGSLYLVGQVLGLLSGATAPGPVAM
jgi:dihydrofolate synthase/folylpolyglutamate synthase